MKIESFTLTGALHLANGIRCQDKTYSISENGTYVIALADGAGSLPQAETGATIASKSAAKCLCKILNENSHIPAVNLSNIILNDVLCHVSQEAHKSGFNVKDYGSTLLCLGLRDEHVIMLHLGDGAVVVWGKNFVEVISYPTNCNCKNFTYLTTSDQASAKAKIKSAHRIEEASGYMLMSDGAYDVLFDDKTNRISNEVHHLLLHSDFFGLNHLISTTDKSSDDISYIAYCL